MVEGRAKGAADPSSELLMGKQRVSKSCSEEDDFSCACAECEVLVRLKVLVIRGL